MKRKIITILILLITLTGCAKALKTEDGKIVTNQNTGQTIYENILCKPATKEILDIYKKNKIDINDLPKCSEYSITDGGYDGLWVTIFVRPLAIIILKIGDIVGNYGLSVIITGILIRAIMIPITKKTAIQSENLKKAQPELDKIEKKYKDKTDQQAQMAKSQETVIIYKKYGINPLSGCLFAFIQLPVFFAFLEAINRVPSIFEGKFLTLQLGTTPFNGLFKGNFNFLYILIIILIVGTTYYSFKSNGNATGNSETQKQMQFMSKFMLIFISFASLSLPTAIALYWITSSMFTIIQNYLVKSSKGVD